MIKQTTDIIRNTDTTTTSQVAAFSISWTLSTGGRARKNCQRGQFIINIYHKGQLTKFYIIFPVFQRNIHVKKKLFINSHGSTDPHDNILPPSLAVPAYSDTHNLVTP